MATHIRLFCSAGMSTSLMVSKMQKAAEEKGLDVDVVAYGVAEVDDKGKEADIILLGPQIRYMKAEVEGKFPDKPVETIEMRDYGMMNGEAVLTRAMDLIK
jgi:PTS system cellobiose-specific IIB component